ncbi:ATP-dependent helicase HrpB [Alteromonas aestuariivivens]|uniref:ATP-dependent helicase HrpB n=1 Tax=Alteromonas aestuariivivens TaxID=1938339 RepID=A0A3D8M9S8_9ALTE|nr:ATP-dependent helicase HrpB [Alteromonas aestuariivivens]RDV26736.1 ATP-dependent helicase HrpB [Alteromonas aestuariivivens]
MLLPSQLPAQAIADELCRCIQQGNVILGAPPGAGKSTVLPLALLQSVPAGRIVMMQPRRVVVRNLAAFLASQLGEEVGQTVGYRIRGESKVSAATRLEIITEGVLARRIQQDPELTGVSVIIFDEFHERSIHSDFGLALALEVQEGLRDDLRLLVMSATLNVEAIRALIPDAKIITSEGRQYPVELRYTGSVQAEKLPQQLAVKALQAVEEHQGDVLVFLSGVGVIRRVQSLIEQRLSGQSQIVVLPLYGAQDKAAQQQALEPDSRCRFKIILATNIAETSLTIEGVKVVIDSGVEKVASFHPSTGLTQLNEQSISQASAIQRQGRAGRLGPGICYRFWAQEQQHRLARHAEPQILREDVTALTLEALSWGTTLEQLKILDLPSQAQRDYACQSLAEIGALEPGGSISAYGRKLAALPCHPKVAHMLYQVSSQPELAAVATLVAAVLEDSGDQKGPLLLGDYLRQLNSYSAKALLRQARRFAQALRIAGYNDDLSQVGDTELAHCLALAYPERIGYRTAPGRYKLASGKGAVMPAGEQSQEAWIVVLEGQQSGAEVTVRRIQPVDEFLLRQLFEEKFATQDRVAFNVARQQMEARRGEGFMAIELRSEPIGQVAGEIWFEAWLSHLSGLAMNDWPLDEQAWQWWYRLSLARELNLAQPQAFDEPAPWPMLASPFSRAVCTEFQRQLAKCRSLRDVETLVWAKALHQQLSWPQQHALDSLLPTHWITPTGRKCRLQYRPDGSVKLSVRLQDMFAVKQPIVLAQGQLTVVVELLSPANRPIQTTSDLGAFWNGNYAEVKKEMKGRYPKHQWDLPGL